MPALERARRSPPISRASLRLTLLIAGGIAALWMAIAADPFATRRLRPTPGADGPLFVGLAWQWSHGVVAMRDFGSTHGPLAQWIAAVGAGLRADGDAARTEPVIGIGLRVASALLLIAFWATVRGRASTLATIIVVSLVVGLPAGWTSSRALSAVLVVVLLGAAVARGDGVLSMARALGIALTWVALELYSPDYSVYVLASAAAVMAHGLVARRNGEAFASDSMRSLARVVGCWLLLNGLLAVAFSMTARAADAGVLSPFERSLRIMLTYADVVGKPWRLGPTQTGALLVGVVCAAGVALRALRDAPPRGKALIVAMATLAIVALRGAIVRSDPGHIRLGLIPGLCLLMWIRPSEDRGLRVRGLWAIAVGALVVGWPGAPGAQLLFDVGTGASPGAWTVFRAARRGPVEIQELPQVRAAAASSNGPVAAFPLDNRVGALLDRELVTPFQQPYVAHTLDLQERYVAGLRAAGSDLQVVFGIDASGAWELDQGQSVTRSPLIFRELLTGFEPVSQGVLDGGFVLLRRAGVEAGLAVERLDYELGAQVDFSHARFAAPTLCPLLRFEVELDHPWFARFGWPAGIAATARLAGRRVGRTRIVPLEDGPFTTYFALMEVGEWPLLFQPGGRAEGRLFDELEFERESGGPFGVQASGFRLLAIDCVVAKEPGIPSVSVTPSERDPSPLLASVRASWRPAP